MAESRAPTPAFATADTAAASPREIAAKRSLDIALLKKYKRKSPHPGEEWRDGAG